MTELSKKRFRVRDSYGVEIDKGQDDALILAVTVVIDEHPFRAIAVSPARETRCRLEQPVGQ